MSNESLVSKYLERRFGIIYNTEINTESLTSLNGVTFNVEIKSNSKTIKRSLLEPQLRLRLQRRIFYNSLKDANFQISYQKNLYTPFNFLENVLGLPVEENKITGETPIIFLESNQLIKYIIFNAMEYKYNIVQGQLQSPITFPQGANGFGLSVDMIGTEITNEDVIDLFTIPVTYNKGKIFFFNFI